MTSQARLLILLALALSLTGATGRPSILAHGDEITIDLKPGQRAEFELNLDRGDFVALRVEQYGLDVLLSLSDRDRPEVDLFYGHYVPETLLHHAERAQKQTLSVVALAGHGTARLIVEALGPASEHERRRAAAFWSTWTGISTLGAGSGARAARSQLESGVAQWAATDDALGKAVAWVELCRAYWLIGEFDLAVDACDQALVESRRADEPAMSARIHYARALVWREQARSGHSELPETALDRALVNYRAAGAGARVSGDSYLEGISALSAGTVHWMRSEFESALRLYDQARRLLDGIDETEANEAQLALGRTLMRLGDLEEALPHLLLSYLGALDRGDHKQEQAARREIGWWFHLDGAHHRASHILASLTGPVARGRLVRVLMAEKKYDAARDLLSILEPDATGYDRAQFYADRCALEVLTGQPALAEKPCQRALGALKNHGDLGGEPWVLSWLARSMESQGRLIEAERVASRAVALLEDQRATVVHPSWRMAFLAERLPAYRTLVDLRMQLHLRSPESGWDRRALDAVEWIRARTLRELVSTEQVSGYGPRSPREHALLLDLDQQARHLAERLFPYRTAGMSSDAPDRSALLAALERLESIRRHAPGSLAPALPPEALDLEALRDVLEPGTAVLAYFLGTPRSYVWVVRRDSVEGHALPPKRTILDVAEPWYEMLSEPWGTLDPEAERVVARRLSALLVGPITESIADTDRLVVVGDDILRLLPFSALPFPGDGGNDDRPMIVDRTVSMLPSLTVLTSLQHRTRSRKPAEGVLAIFSDPVYDIDGRAPAGIRPRGGGLARLPSTAEEARRIVNLAKDYGNVLHVEGHNATRARFLSGELSNYRIIHVAGHAITRSMPRGLVLSRWSRDGRALPDVLGFQELYGLDLPAELAVASACSTGLGEEVAGEGLRGLTRGFMQAGTPRVVVSLWEVRDQATADLMSRFYEALLVERLPPADALRAAQLALLDQSGSDPREWAAFVLQGAWSPFVLPEVSNQ